MTLRRLVITATSASLLTACAASGSTAVPVTSSASAASQLRTVVHDMVLGLSSHRRTTLCTGFKNEPTSVVEAFVRPLSLTGADTRQAADALTAELSTVCVETGR